MSETPTQQELRLAKASYMHLADKQKELTRELAFVKDALTTITVASVHAMKRYERALEAEYVAGQKKHTRQENMSDHAPPEPIEVINIKANIQALANKVIEDKGRPLSISERLAIVRALKNWAMNVLFNGSELEIMDDEKSEEWVQLIYEQKKKT